MKIIMICRRFQQMIIYKYIDTALFKDWVIIYQTEFLRVCPHGVAVKAIERVRIPVALLRSLSGKYPWESYGPLYPPSYGLDSTTTVLFGEWFWH